MKRNYILLIFSLYFSFGLFAQIQINSTDMPSVNDTVRTSTASTPSLVIPDSTGINYHWNYASLTPFRQKLDTFVSVTSTPFSYQLYFNNSIAFPNHKADFALPVAIPTPTNSIGLSVSNTFGYFRNKNNKFSQVGFGSTINSVPTSTKYDSIDYIYQFPLAYGNKDSCVSVFDVTVPTFLFYKQHKKRVNEVDGWGTITTPLGTFQCIRVKSTMYITDSIFSIMLGFGTKTPRPTQYEYKWLTTNGMIPVLQANAQKAGNSKVVNSVIYKDIYRSAFLAMEEQAINKDLTVYPNPAQDKIYINSFGNVPIEELYLVNLATSQLVQTIHKNELVYTNNAIELTISSLPRSNYLLVAKTNNGIVSEIFVK
ncbi:MAG: T9SS type A sorting domain-containing protein [Bacteroidetes bacterium]|nr:T9SS type A sorting domain-containing protein [Bacteroidota bacterium]